jgi:predicted RNase H-like nuclease
MRAVLGIDAAWTLTQPSGVALSVETSAGWQFVAIDSSYEAFVLRANEGSRYSNALGPDPNALLKAASVLGACEVSLVAVDMPLACSQIKARRFCDDAVSKAYGARKCGTHSPTEARPGALSCELKQKFGEAGFPLRTNIIQLPGLIEVYPHPALCELAAAPERLPYKVSKVRKYWPNACSLDRRRLLLEQWREILNLLGKQLKGVTENLSLPPQDATSKALKSFEDSLDAAICAWVGICVLERRAKPFGDEDAAIWIPALDVVS